MESFAGIAQEECYYSNYNFPVQPANKPGIRQGPYCKTTLITLVDGKGCSALAALWLVGKTPEGHSNHGSTLKEETVRYWWKILSIRHAEGHLSSN